MSEQTQEFQNEGGVDAGLYARFRARYTNAVESWDIGKRLTYWGGSLALAAVLIVISVFVPGGNYIATIFGIPAGVIFAAVFIGIKHLSQANSQKLTLRERLSPKKRMRIAGVSAVGSFLFAAILSSYVPYALGGAIILGAFIAIGDFMRLTPEEQYLQENELLDPRDFDQDAVYVEPEETASDFSWEGQYADEYAEDASTDDIRQEDYRSN